MMKDRLLELALLSADWKEEDHPRAEDGKFGEGEGNGGPRESDTKTWLDGMPKERLKGLKAYAGEASYIDIRALNTGRDCCEFHSRQEVEALVAHIDQALASGPIYRGTVYRGINNLPMGYGEAILSAESLEWVSFSSSSKDMTLARRFAMTGNERGKEKIIFEIEGHEGVDITEASKYGEEEDEVLLPRNSQFKVMGGEKDPGGAWVIKLQAA